MALPQSMRAVRLTSDGLIYDACHPLPVAGADQTLIRVTRAGICATDLELIKGYYGFQGILGHELVGLVEQSSDARWLGRRVVCSINFADPHSPEFAEYGLEHHPGRTVLGIVGHDGGMADFVCVPTRNLLEVPAGVSDDQAVFTEPLAAALRLTEQIVLPAGQPAVVIGPGRLGLLVGQVLAARGAEVILLGRNQQSLELPARLGFATRLAESLPDSQFHLVVDCSGNPQGLELALRLTRPLGRLVLKSTFAGSAPINLTKLVVDEIQLIGSRCGPMAPAVRCLERGQVDVLPLIDARYNVADALAAFEHASQPGVRKVLLHFD